MDSVRKVRNRRRLKNFSRRAGSGPTLFRLRPHGTAESLHFKTSRLRALVKLFWWRPALQCCGMKKSTKTPEGQSGVAREAKALVALVIRSTPTLLRLKCAKS